MQIVNKLIILGMISGILLGIVVGVPVAVAIDNYFLGQAINDARDREARAKEIEKDFSRLSRELDYARNLAKDRAEAFNEMEGQFKRVLIALNNLQPATSSLAQEAAGWCRQLIVGGDQSCRRTSFDLGKNMIALVNLRALDCQPVVVPTGFTVISAPQLRVGIGPGDYINLQKADELSGWHLSPTEFICEETIIVRHNR